MVVPAIGLDGQILISSSAVLVVGAGGIGSTVLLYLAGTYSFRTVLSSHTLKGFDMYAYIIPPNNRKML